MTSKRMNLDLAKGLANQTGKNFNVYLWEGIWHCVQADLQEVPADAKHLQTIEPTQPKPEPQPRDPRLGRPIWQIWG